MTKDSCGICNKPIIKSRDNYMKIVLHPKGGSVWLLEFLTHYECYNNKDKWFEP